MEPIKSNSQNQNSKGISANIDVLTSVRPTESNAIQIPEITLPKGGGALKGIDEKFRVNAVNGTSGVSIPLPITPGRNGFSPTLSLSYNSGSGNSSFGLGWSLSYPMIQRRTEKRLPRYFDNLSPNAKPNQTEDIFMLTGVEDLVPFLEEVDGKYTRNKSELRNGYKVERYRPRIEGGFARIEKIQHKDHGVYWKVTTRNNMVTLYGRTENSRIADPDDPSRIFQWMPEFSYDNKGNWIQYEYKKEDLSNVPQTTYEKNRLAQKALIANSYLKRVCYGNQKAYYPASNKPYDPQQPTQKECFYELVLDYGEHDPSNPIPNGKALWDCRKDPFSSYRPGFEIRTYRLCKRVLMFHHFENEKQFAGTKEEEFFGKNYLVKSLDFEYKPSSINGSGQAETTYLKAITQKGYIRKPDGEYSKKSLPPMEFAYQELHWNTSIKTVDREHIVNAPIGLTNNYQWLDLYGEGISGILTEQAGGWYYKNNLGAQDDDQQPAFAPAKKVAPKPSFLGLSNGILALQDLEANGNKQITVNSPGIQGYFELDDADGWETFRAFEHMPNINFGDANTRMLDLNGDGQPELVMTEDNVFVWYAANGKQGYHPAEFAHKTFDEEQGPAIVFADLEQTVFLADMSGDGLTDIVRIRNGEICYWANKGFGKFSAKISMSNAPLFDHPDLFNPQFLHLADVSGTGATDLVYLGKNMFKGFINLSGNSWSEAHEIEPFSPIDRNAQLSVVDLLGTGTSCIVWSSDLSAFSNAPMRYIDLMNGKKPHILVFYQNNFGKETSISYKSSTQYYLEDKKKGTPWITKLPFPVHVVSELVTEEKITDVRFSSSYSYHNGYYDHAEREFRGFGMVEQLDTEHYTEWEKNNANNRLETSEALYQKPILTKTWFHTGAFLDREKILGHFKTTYWFEAYNKRFPWDKLQVMEPELPDAHLSEAVKALPGDEFREAARACKGMMLRQETFALDAPENPSEEALQLQMKPFTVATHNCHIQLLQPRAVNEYGVFLITDSEALAINYERDEHDFRLSHTLTLKTDELGNILESASVVYPRQLKVQDHPLKKLKDRATLLNYDRDDEKAIYESSLSNTIQLQSKTLITYQKNTYTHDIVDPAHYMLRLLCKTQVFEVTGLEPNSKRIFTIGDLKKVMVSDHNTLQYWETSNSKTCQKRLLENLETTFYDNSLSDELELGKLGVHGIAHQSYQLAFTDSLLKHIYGNKLPSDPVSLEHLLGSQDKDSEQADAKFTKRRGHWWIRSGVVHYSKSLEEIQEKFFTPERYTDPFGSSTYVVPYKNHFLFAETIIDELGNEIKALDFNFRTMIPSKLKDINDNIAEIAIDELGLVKAMALKGKGEEADSLVGILEYVTEEEKGLTGSYFLETDSDALHLMALNLLGRATSRFVYNFDAYKNTKLSKKGLPFKTHGHKPSKLSKPNPAVVGGILREQHGIREPSLQLSFEYSDGLGNTVMAKSQAEPGEALDIEISEDLSAVLKNTDTGTKLRWIGNGRTILNNKGNPVKQYEPYFSVNPFYEDESELVERGVTPIMYYDSLGRLIRTDYPNGTFSKVEFDSWRQKIFDQNDTVLLSKWYNNRKDGKLGKKEQEAAKKAAQHHNTPTVLHLDTLGRPILSVVHNRTGEKDPWGKVIPTEDEFYSTQIVLDMEGNTLKVIDAKGNTVMFYKYDMLGHRLYTNSMDAGQRWVLNNSMGNPVRTWDSRQHMFSYEYDELQRPVKMRVKGGAENLDHLFEVIAYGDWKNQTKEERKAKKLNNQLGEPCIHKDTSGITYFDKYDFKRNLLKSRKQLLKK
ncbi:MAG: SpvB/TcaC N-terminal domain-containing protein [Bacteroidota bacterium]